MRLAPILIAFVLLPIACRQEHRDVSPPNLLISRFDTLVPQLLKRENVPGGQIAIIDSGRVAWSGSYGLTDKSSSSAVTDSTLFNIGSVSKSITAWAVMVLLNETDIPLDSPVQDHMTRWRFPASEYDTRLVTIRRLLNHTSGLSILPASESFSYPPTLEETLSRSYGSFGRLRLVHEPGTLFEYNNGNYLLLQMFIEDVSGIEFSSYVKSKVLDPLGMTRTTYAPADRQVNMNFAASGGVFTTAADLGRFIAATMTNASNQPGRNILSPETLNKMLIPENETGGRYGLGYKILRLSNNLSLITHDGANPGWRAMFIADPEKGVGIVVLTNSDAGGKIVADIVCTWGDWETEIELIGLCDGAEPIPKSQYAEDQ